MNILLGILLVGAAQAAAPKAKPPAQDPAWSESERAALTLFNNHSESRLCERIWALDERIVTALKSVELILKNLYSHSPHSRGCITWYNDKVHPTVESIQKDITLHKDFWQQLKAKPPEKLSIDELALLLVSLKNLDNSITEVSSTITREYSRNGCPPMRNKEILADLMTYLSPTDPLNYEVKKTFPYAKHATPAGYVTSPFAPHHLVDVRGYLRGTKVRDPYSKKIFLVP